MKKMAAVAALVAASVAGPATTATASAASGTSQHSLSSAISADGQHSLGAASAAAQGAFDGMWAMAQSNDYVVRLILNPPDSAGNFTGTADFVAGSGSVTGQLSGSDVVFDIKWDQGHTGRYTGHQESADQWSGESVDLDEPSIQADWWAHRA
jgi:hypothetical protein